MMSDLSTFRSDLANAQKKIGDMLNELQQKYGCEIDISVRNAHYVGDIHPFSLVTLEARVESMTPSSGHRDREGRG